MSWRRPARWVLLAAAVLAVPVPAALGDHGSGGPRAGTARHPDASRSATVAPVSYGLPRLGPATVVETDDVGDPFVLTVPGRPGSARYVLYWTTDWDSNVPTAVSDDHVHWRRVADSLPVLPVWAVGSKTMTWGPAVARTAKGYVLYYATQDAASGRQCIGAAAASEPTGPFVDGSSAPLVCQRALGGDIDPTVVTDAAGGRHLLWKNDGNAVGVPVGIWEQPLSADGLALTGAATEVLTAGRPWEHGIVEGPAMLPDTHGGWWLFYSGGTWQSDTYDTGVAHCVAPAGPCTETTGAPLLSSTPTAVSPGGFDTFLDGAGKLWASYSAFPSVPTGPEDAMRMNRVLEIAPVLSH